MSNINKRLWKELEIINQLSSDFFAAGPISHNQLNCWQAFIKGPPKTPYREGVFKLDIKFPIDYPFSPPSLNFTTKIFHPNIGISDGHVCMESLFNKWKPVMTIENILNEVYELMKTPNADLYYEPVVSFLFKNENELFVSKAEEYTKNYATG